MEAGNFKGTKRPLKISYRRKHLNSQRVEAEPMPQTLFNRCEDTMQECMRNSKDAKSEDISREHDEIGQFDGTSSWIEKQQATEIVDGCKVDIGPKTLYENHSPLPIDSNALAREGKDFGELTIQTEQEPTKRRTSSPNPLQESRIFEQETRAQLKAYIKKLQKENSVSCHQMQKVSEYCVQLSSENHSLLKQLKEMCSPDTIAYLEAKNPDKRVDNKI